MATLPKASAVPVWQVAWLLAILACVVGSLFLVFNYLASVEVGEVAGVVLFLVAAGLLVALYMVGLIFLTLAGISLLTRGRWKGRGVASGHA